MAKKYLLYIHDERFEKEDKKSELVNRLLDSYYTKPVIKTKQDAELAVKPLQVNPKSHAYVEPVTYKPTGSWGA